MAAVTNTFKDEGYSWKHAIQEDAYARLAKDPTSIVGMYLQDPTKRPKLDDPENAPMPPSGGRVGQLNRLRGEFTQALETANANHRNEVPLNFWLQFSPAELSFLGGGDFKEVVDYVEQVQANMAYEAQLQADIDKKLELRMQASKTRRSFLDNAGLAFARLKDLTIGGIDSTDPNSFVQQKLGEMGSRVDETEKIRRDAELALRGRGDEIYEDEIASFMASERKLLGWLRGGEGGGKDIATKGGVRTLGAERLDLEGLEEDQIRRYVEQEMTLLDAGGHDFKNMSDEDAEKFLADREQQIRAALRDDPTNDAPLQAGDTMNFVEGGLAALGQVIDKGIKLGSWLVERQAEIPLLGWAGDTWLETLRQDNLAKNEQLQAQLTRELGGAPAETLAQLTSSEVSKAWDDLQEMDPDTAQEYLDIAGGDSVMAYGFFQADIQSIISPEEQVAYLEEQYATEKERIEFLKDGDFRASAAVMDKIAAYGRLVPGRLSTMATLLLLGDEETYNTATLNAWDRFFETISNANERAELYDFTPSAALDIDGTAAGLALDLGTGIAFDPTTYIFGPRLGARGVKPATAAQAKGLAKGAYVTQTAEDIVAAVSSPSRGMSSVMHQTKWLPDPVRQKLFTMLDFNPQTLPKAPWRGKFPKAQELRTDFLDEIADLTIDVGDVTSLKDDILKNGFEEPVVVQVSRGDRSIILKDGAKRLKAAKEAGVSHVPVELRIADEVPRGKVVLEGYSDEATEELIRMSELQPVGDVGAADESLRNNLLSGVQSRHGGPNSGFRTGKTIHLEDETLDIHMIPGDNPNEGVYYAANAKGEVVSVVQASRLGGERTGGLATAEAYAGKQLTAKIMDAAHEMGDDLILNIDVSSVSEAGAATLRKYAKQKLDSALPTATVGAKAGKVKSASLRGRLASTNLKTGVVRLDEAAIKADYDAGLPYLAGTKGATSSEKARILQELGTDAKKVRKLLEKKGGASAYQKFIHEHELWHVRNPGKSGFEAEKAATKHALDWLGGGRSYVDDTVVRVDDLLREGETLGADLKKAGSLETDVLRPDSFLPRRALFGDVDLAAVQEILEEGIMMGASPTGAVYAAQAVHATERLRHLVRNNKPGAWFQRYVTPHNMAKNLELTGPHAMSKLEDLALRMWGQNTDKVNQWMERLYQIQRRRGQAAATEAKARRALQPSIDRWRTMVDQVGSPWGDEIAGFKGQLSEGELAQAQANRNQLKAVVDQEGKYIRRELVKIADIGKGQWDNKDLHDLVIEMFEDYNRTHIATNPAWKSLVDDETGMVPWFHLGKGRAPKPDPFVTDRKPFLARDAVEGVEDFKFEKMDETYKGLLHSQNTYLNVELPISPLELTIASEVGGAAYTRFTHWAAVAEVREVAQAFNRFWIVDKVLSGATAMTVSFDELLRMFHIGGDNAVWQYLGDRTAMTEARVKAALHGKGLKKSKGTEYLSPKKEERLRALGDFSTHLKNAERQTFEQFGLGWTDIAPGEAGFEEAAQQWAAQMLQDTGFRAMLKGRDAFREWWTTPDAQRLQQQSVLSSKGMSFVDSADDYFNAFSELFEEVVLKPAKKAGKENDIRRAWLETADKIEATGGRPHNLPDSVMQHMPPVRGTRREMGGKTSAMMSEKFFEKLFLDPVNYRRGFLSEWVRAHESSRLRSLFASQGKQIISDSQLEAMFNMRGLSGTGRPAMRQWAYEQAIAAGYIPEGYLSDMVERAALQEIENTLYSFEIGSRMGAQAKSVFPFGKPWADMAAFWGKEVMRKPALRGWVNDSNFMMLRSLNDAGAFNYVPINRTTALLSRLAHTDFEIDRGLIGGEGEGMLHEGGVLPGSSKSDFSPLLFLPTAGDNPFSVMLPGLGPVPVYFLDMYLNSKYDPVEQPEEYQRLLESISDYIPMAGFQQGGTVSRLLGGGAVGKTAALAADFYSMGTGDSFFNLTSILGDISREIDRTRELSALLADPAELDALLSASSAEEANLLLEALALEADKRASGAHAVETISRWMVPVKQTYDPALAEIHDVWFDAARSFGELDLLEGRDPKRMSADERNQLVNDIRTEFFSLPSWQRDLLVAQQPSLAVNLVGAWEWTENAINENIPGSQYSYRSGGTKEQLARHRTFVSKGYVRPTSPIERARRILGTVDNARRSAVKELYIDVVDTVNNQMWEHFVSEGTKEMLQEIVDSDFGKKLDLRTTEEVWRNWSTLEADLELYIADELGVDPVKGESTRKADQTVFDRLRKAIAVPTNEQPWGTTFPGLDEESVSSRFKDWEILEVSEKSRKIAEALKLNVSEGMLGSEVFEQVQAELTNRRNVIYDVVRPSYDRYVGTRNLNTGTNMLYEASQSSLVAPEVQDKIKEFMFKHDLNLDRRDLDRRNGLSFADQQRMRDEFLFIMNGSKDQKIPWNDVWTEQYSRYYGELDWTPPTPPSPFDENGDIASNVTVPFIRNVVDGDTLLIQEKGGSKVLQSVRLIGIRAAEMTGPESEQALKQEEELKSALSQAVRNGDNIFLVRDPRFGSTDKYGRMLAWLFIGDTPFYNPEDLRPHQDPSGGVG